MRQIVEEKKGFRNITGCGGRTFGSGGRFSQRASVFSALQQRQERNTLTYELRQQRQNMLLAWARVREPRRWMRPYSARSPH